LELKTLNIFYEEPEPDRWLPFDRYPRKLIRRIVRGKNRPGGQMMIALNLMAGLQKLGYNYRFNDYRYLRSNPQELACVIGKPHIIFEKKITRNPILFGAAVFSHPVDCPALFTEYPNVKKILVPGDWIKEMFAPYYGNRVLAWPVGIDTEKWRPEAKHKDIDCLIYDKVLWQYELFENELIWPVLSHLKNMGLKTEVIRYGKYKSDQYLEKLQRTKFMIFLCPHETQGLAYQEALSCDVPILAWDQGGFWPDPSYYPEKVKFQPVSSVPYWDERCGMKFKDFNEFYNKIDDFLTRLAENRFEPRSYILEHLTLEKCAQKYLDIIKSI
jgi:glycosyltransferase involved in cell wall biosynthesis